MLRRDVAATVLRRFGPGTDPDDDGGAARAQEIIARALRSGSFEHPGCARLLDVLAPGAPGLPDGVLGAAVAEWVPGLSLADAVADGMLKPLAAARALQPLAAAAEAAHRHGHVLGCDHPQRIRLNHDGRLQMGFALPRPELTPADDVRGLGAALYTLLTARWPLSPSDAARAGLKPAERGVDGAPLPPSTVRPGVPVELETLVVGTLGADSDAGRVRTAAAVRSVVDEVVAEADRVVLFPPEHDGVPPEPGDVWQPRGAVPKQPDPRKRRKLAVGMAGLGLCVLGVAGYMSVQLGELFGDPTPRIVVGSSARWRRRCRRARAGGRRCGSAGGRCRGQGGRSRRLRRRGRPRQRRPGLAGDRRQPGHGMEDLQLQAAVPGAQAGRRDHDVVRVAGAAVEPDHRVAEPRHRDRDPVGAVVGREAHRHRAAHPRHPGRRRHRGAADQQPAGAVRAAVDHAPGRRRQRQQHRDPRSCRSAASPTDPTSFPERPRAQRSST